MVQLFLSVKPTNNKTKMTIEKLHEITGRLLAIGKGKDEVAVNVATFPEAGEVGAVYMVEQANALMVPACDDSGELEEKFHMLVLTGAETP